MDDYTICGKIGKGAEGVVYRVRHVPTSKDFAMKMISCPDQIKVNAALKEIKILLHLSHRHIVSYEDFFLLFYNDKVRHEFAMANTSKMPPSENAEAWRMCTTNNGIGNNNINNNKENCGLSDSLNFFCGGASGVCVCLVMELCTCGDMQNVIHEAKQKFMESGSHPISEAQILSWMEQCASALTFVHEQGFLHRDLKPTNILFDNHKELKIGDFGLAATVGRGHQSAVGTPLYLAPECMLHQVYDEKVDVWGLGVVILELVILQEQPINSLVLENPLIVETVVQQVADMGFSVKLGCLLRDMLQRHPEGRPSTAAILRRVIGMKSQILAETKPVPCTAPTPNLCKNLCCSDLQAVVCESCKVEAESLANSSCVAVLSEGCECARRKHHRRQIYEPTSLSAVRRSQGNRLHPLNDFESNSLLSHRCRSKGSLSPTLSRFLLPPFSVGGTSSVCGNTSTECSNNTLVRTMRSTIIEIPKDYPTITLGLAAARCMPHVRKILVAGNTIHNISLTLDETLPDNIKIIGGSPAPVIEVDSVSSAILCASGRGIIENFVIRHAGKRNPSTEVPIDGKNRKKSPRPIAVSVVGGEWHITKCRISSCNGSGISISPNLDVVVSHCIILEVKTAGVIVMEEGRGLFEKNSFSNCEFAAFFLKRGSTARLLGNHITDGAETGIFCQDASGLVEDNFIANNGGCGVVVKGSDTSVIFRGNRVVGNAQAGFFCCDGASPIITKNEIKDNKRAGVLIKTMASPKITKNVIRGGREAGIYVFEKGAGLIEENKLQANSNAGILVTTRGFPHVVRNIIRGNLYEGVWVCKGGGGAFFENDLRGNEKGSKDIEESSSVVWIGNRES